MSKIQTRLVLGSSVLLLFLVGAAADAQEEVELASAEALMGHAIH